MRSRFADKFNHDADAWDYDLDVSHEADPIRAGYQALLDWVAASAATNGNSVVLDLGAGTGNLSSRLPAVGQLVCVDISQAMSDIGRRKLAARQNVAWEQLDLLEYFDQPRGPFDAVVSTYAIHHLTEAEKALLFKRIAAVLRAHGRAVFGDLMFENPPARQRFLRHCRQSGQEKLAQTVEDEFFWDVKTAVQRLQALGFTLETQRFSELSWGIAARLQ